MTKAAALTINSVLIALAVYVWAPVFLAGLVNIARWVSDLVPHTPVAACGFAFNEDAPLCTVTIDDLRGALL